ncbi:hypothetical protein COB11_02510 [Candidatus Aerophobetes bacterium]|uniref:Uncharacterized protein n=1 Tax=Aerophobetes bacterium TaxID=2030807 RepID=A0A2A4YKM3_UNCAE|nr:MAG: hypothetical protein COB11_02510 [Candidatus Aerophobetes bacterium]
MTVMNHFIDITDTPYLPDHFTDPIFKAMMPPLIDLLETVLEGKFIMVPTEESEKPTGERLFEFVEKMKEVYADGFTWSDLMVTIRSSVEFMGSFPYLEKAEKEKCVIDIINKIIDETDTPKVPDIFADRIFKAMVPSFVREIFKRLP